MITKVSLSEYARFFTEHVMERYKDAIQRALRVAEKRAIQIVVRNTRHAEAPDPLGLNTGGAVYNGLYVRAWRTDTLEDGFRIYNLATYAGIIEYGRHPRPMWTFKKRRRGGSRGPQKPMTGFLGAMELWAIRKLHVKKKEARSAAFAMVQAINKRGLRGRHVLGHSVPEIKAIIHAEIGKAVAKAARAETDPV